MKGSFEENTQTIREWLDHGAVSTDRLTSELESWLGYFKTGTQRRDGQIDLDLS